MKIPDSSSDIGSASGVTITSLVSAPLGRTISGSAHDRAPARAAALPPAAAAVHHAESRGTFGQARHLLAQPLDLPP